MADSVAEVGDLLGGATTGEDGNMPASSEERPERAVLESEGDEHLIEEGQAWLVRKVQVADAAVLQILVRDLENTECQDAFLFDEDYSIEASTGQQLWEGARELYKALVRPDGPLAKEMERCPHVIECGSGTGLVGLCAAALGAHVLLTDVASIAHSVLRMNIARNATAGPPGKGAWHKDALVVGLGTAIARPLDWRVGVREQVADLAIPERMLVLAADCVWSVDLLEAFVCTTCDLLELSVGSSAFVLGWERYTPGSKVFVATIAVRSAFEAKGCVVDEVSPHPETYSFLRVHR